MGIDGIGKPPGAGIGGIGGAIGQRMRARAAEPFKVDPSAPGRAAAAR